MNGSFHGRSLACMAASGKADWPLFPPHMPGFRRVPPHDLPALQAATDQDTVAVMLEPIQGEAGVQPMDPDWLTALQAHCRAMGLLLICDEIQTGCGRCGELFLSRSLGLQPDILTLGKGLGAGMPVAALLTRPELDCFAPGEHGGTFAGNALAMAAVRAVLQRLTAPGFLDGVRQRGVHLRSRLRRFGSVRGAGLLLALERPQGDGPAVVARAAERRLLLNSPRPDCIRFMPTLTITTAEINRCCDLLEEILS
ncbi:MAG: aspartate aminotransferase family protein, partial [Planctomycetota bacterium]